MRVLLFGKRSDELQPLLESKGFTITEDSPEVVITYGGDGTLLSAERKYPGLPKLAIRDNSICIKCTSHKDEELFEKLVSGQLKVTEFTKLEAELKDQKILAINDFVIRNQLPTHAIRFLVFKNNEQLTKQLVIGDGVVVSTPFGASGYYKSITGHDFSDNFGLAFNNTTEKYDPIYFKENDVIVVKIIRGPATLSFDNSPDIFTLEGNSEVSFKPSNKHLKLYELETLRCSSCQIKRRLDIP